MIIEALASRPVVIVAAHPDDETVSLGGVLPRLKHAVLVTITDGSPRNPDDARRAGCSSREEYAQLRQSELRHALDVAGLAPHRTRTLHIVDQEVSLEMAYVTMRLVDVFNEFHPAAILTHPYEGGHPDHDATAFAVHAACARVPNPPVVFEFASYHARPDNSAAIEVCRFLPGVDDGETITLTDEERERKVKMMARYGSQLHMLEHWPHDVEVIREAPTYDFTEPPHAGKLFYENFDWGVDGARWRLLAEEALRTLGAASAAP